MKHLAVRIVILLVSWVVIYIIGYLKARSDDSWSRMIREHEHWRQLAELDRQFLASIPVRPSTLETGEYVKETRFPGSAPIYTDLNLVFSDGKFALPRPSAPQRGGMADTLIQNGNVVSWTEEGIMYEANAESVGVIDGDIVWGRVYGWNPGNEAIGDWRITRKIRH